MWPERSFEVLQVTHSTLLMCSVFEHCLHLLCLFQRYYGRSLPFGTDSFGVPQIGLLTVEQALADYAVMIRELKQQLGAADCPVIVFGGRWGPQAFVSP